MSFQLTVNTDQTQGTVSKGIHLAKCIKAEVKENKAKDGQNLVLDFEILTPGEQGRRVRLYQSLKDSVAWRYTKVFQAFGVDTSKGKAQITQRTFEGQKVRVAIDHDDWQGETRSTVADVLPVREGSTPSQPNSGGPDDGEAENSEEANNADVEATPEKNLPF